MQPEEQASLVQAANQLEKLRQGAVAAALVLLIVSFVYPSSALAYARFAAWATAAFVTVLRGTKVKQLGLPTNYGSAVIYALVAFLPLLKQR